MPLGSPPVETAADTTLFFGCDAVQEHYKKSVPKDTWNLLLDFAATIKEDCSNYDPMGTFGGASAHLPAPPPPPPPP